MVARGAGAAGPVLLACRQWDPLGLARRLPSLGVGAWYSAPLLPWRVQCCVRVCAALVAGSGGSARYLVLCLSRFPLPAPRVPRCVWRAVPSGCSLPSLAGTPSHAVCAFRKLGLVALLVVPTCPLRVCALTLPRRPPPPRVSWRAHLARSRHPALVGPFHVVRAPPHVLPRSVAPSGVLQGGGLVQVPPYLAWGCAPSVGRVRGICPVGAACRGGGGGPSPGGLACHCFERRLVSVAVPPPAARPLERAARVPRPVCPGCGRCGLGDPAPAPQRVPLRAGVARCGGGGRASPGGVPSTIVSSVWGQALPLLRLSALWAGCRGSLATWCGSGRGCVPHYPLAVSAGGAGVGTRHRPHSARSCVLWGQHEGARGGCPLPRCGASGDGHSPIPDLSSVRACSWGPLPTSCGCGECRREEPAPTAQREPLRGVGAA